MLLNACQWEEASPESSPFLSSGGRKCFDRHELRARCEVRYPLQPGFHDFALPFPKCLLAGRQGLVDRRRKVRPGFRSCRAVGRLVPEEGVAVQFARGAPGGP